MAKPIEGSFPEFFSRYIKLVPEESLAEAFAAQQTFIDHFFKDIPTDKTTFAYAPGKWTIKVLLQHIMDAERIFNYRALSIARGETQPLPGFEEDDYAKNSGADLRDWGSMVEELKHLRQSTIILYDTFPPGALQNTGVSNGREISVNALGFITIGHVYHHINIIKERYLG